MKKLILVLFLGLMVCSLAFAGTITNLTPKTDLKHLESDATETPRVVSGGVDDALVAPFPEGFDLTTGTLPPAGWVVLNVNADASLWKTSTTLNYRHTGARGCYYMYSSVNAADEWLISSAATLTGGVSYRVSFWVKTGGYAETYELKYGVGQTVTDMTNTIVGATTTASTAWTQMVYDFTPAATGSYNIGWHCISDADMYYIAIDDLDLTESPVTGRCCYGNPANQCTDGIDAAACAQLGGTFALGLDCTTPCPIPCELLTTCAASSEVEPNDACPAPALQATIGCDMTLYGLLCPETDVDYYMVSVPAGYRMNVSQFDGENCATNPATCILTDIYYDDCTLAAAGSTSGWNLSNPGDVPWVVYLAVKSAAGCRGAYSLVATCCPLVTCANPILIPGVVHFEQTVTTCCASSAYAGTYENACAGSAYTSGPATIFRFNILTNGTLTFSVLGPEMADEQIMVFTDCADPVATCVGSQDMEAGAVDPEVILNLPLAPGVYYVGISYYGASACGPLTLTIDSDVILPVELMDFTATPGNGAVSLAWRTASETNNARFEIVRNGETMALVPSQGDGATERRYTYTDDHAVNGTVYRYDLVSVDLLGNRETLQSASAMPMLTAAAVTEYRLLQNYPNPFNPTTTLAFDLLESGVVSLKVFNLMGQDVATIAQGSMTAGRHSLTFDASNLPSGIYLARLEVNGFSADKKMLLMK